MSMIKKLTFGPFFLLNFGYLCFLVPSFTKSSASFLSLSLDAFIPFIVITALALLSSFFFCLLVALSQDWKLVLPIGLIGALIPILFLPPALSLYLVIGTGISLLVTFITLSNKLKTYLTFQPSVLLSPTIRNLATLLALVICLVYFLSVSAEIKQQGVQIPDPVIDSALKLTPQTEKVDRPALTPQQKQILEQAKKNPEILKGTGYTLKDLEALEQANGVTPASLKDTIKKQFQAMVKPYESFIAPSLAILVFLSLVSLISLLGLLVPILLWLTFLILKDTGFIKFTTEMREVKKLVV